MISMADRSAAASAVDRLNALLTRLSVIKLKDLGLTSTPGDAEIDILGHIEVLGRSHTLACAVRSSAEPEILRLAAEKLRSCTARLPGNVTRLIVVPYLSASLRALCMKNQINCMDMCGNAYLAIDEVFISTRCSPSGAESASPAFTVAAETAKASPRAGVQQGFPPLRAQDPSAAKRSERMRLAVGNSR